MAEYDAIASDYPARAQGEPIISLSYAWISEAIAPVRGSSVCDLGCGSGELSRRLADRGASVTGLDLSPLMVQEARDRDAVGEVTWVIGDATQTRLATESFDAVVASLMLMDLSDFRAVFAEACRILKPGGLMAWTIMHPCFQSPYSAGLPDDTGALVHRRIVTYAAQHWRSTKPGTIRGTVGAWHRPITEYLTGFIESGFTIDQVAEPVIPAAWPLARDRWHHYVLPPLLAVRGIRQPSWVREITTSPSD